MLPGEEAPVCQRCCLFFFFMGTDHLRRNPVRVSASREGELLLLLVVVLVVLVVVVLGGGSAQTRLV